jgi:Fic family protein
MVRLKKKVIRRRTYYYLEHSIRDKGKVIKKELYIGTRRPNNIEELKEDFLVGVFRERWHPSLDRVRKEFSKESKRMSMTARKKELETFVIRFTYDTQRIEGSRLTLRETADLLESGVTPKGKSIQDVKEAEAHKELFYEMLRYKKDLSLQIILYWHKKLFQATKPDIAGKVRQHQVAISGSKFLPPFPAEINPLLREFFRWYARNRDKLHPVELATLVHLKFVTIHPFADGNGRISRLLMNFVLNRRGYPMLNIPYERRTSYYNALEKAQTKNSESAFLLWLIKRYMKANEKYIGKETG